MADGDGLVVPIGATFEDMKEVTKASSIGLPTAGDIQNFFLTIPLDLSSITNAQPPFSAAGNNVSFRKDTWLASRNSKSEEGTILQSEPDVSEVARSGTLSDYRRRIAQKVSEMRLDKPVGFEQWLSAAKDDDYDKSKNPTKSSSQQLTRT